MTETAQRLGVIPGLHEDLYHADPDSISASSAKDLLRSPAHFLAARENPKTSDAMELGTVVHSMILGVGSPYVAVEGNRNRNDVKAKIEAAEAEGKIVLKPEQLTHAERMADAVLTHELAGKLLSGGDPAESAEVSMFWTDPTWDVTRRCRWDWINGERGIGVDLKTAVDANPDDMPKAIVKWGYDLSAAWYLAVSAGCEVDLRAYCLVFVEKAPPYAVVVAELDEEFMDRGRALAARALDTYRACLDSGQWPSYLPDDAFISLTPPAWARIED